MVSIWILEKLCPYFFLLNGYKRFFLAAFGDAVWKLVAIAFVGVGIAILGRGVDMLILGLVIGSLAKLATHLFGLRDKLRQLTWHPQFDRALLREFAILAAPLIIGILFAKLRDLFNNVTAFSTVHEAGLIQANEFGKKLVGAVSVIIPYTIAIALFPFLCDMVNRDDREELANTLTNSGRLILSVLLPAACVLAALSTPVTRFLFEGGEFGATAVRLTAAAMACYSLYLPAAALEPMLMQAFFADRRTIAITATGIVFSSLSMLISLVGIVMLNAKGLTAVVIVAAGFTLSRTLKSITLVLLMRRTAPVFPLKPTLAFLLRISITGLACAAAAYAAARATRSALANIPFPNIRGLSAAQFQSLPALAAGGIAAGVLYLLCVWLLRIKEPRTMLEWALRRRRSS